MLKDFGLYLDSMFVTVSAKSLGCQGISVWLSPLPVAYSQCASPPDFHLHLHCFLPYVMAICVEKEEGKCPRQHVGSRKGFRESFICFWFWFSGPFLVNMNP